MLNDCNRAENTLNQAGEKHKDGEENEQIGLHSSQSSKIINYHGLQLTNYLL